MKKKIHLSIPEPCHEDWQEMTTEQQGRFCGSCQKTVVDFSDMTDTQILNYFTKSSGRVCGRFQKKQVNKTYQPLPVVITPNWLKAGALASGLLVAGVAQGQHKVPTDLMMGDVAIELPIEEMGEVAIEKEIIATPEKIVFRGIVTDESGEPLIGANLYLKGTSLKTLSDFDGTYTLEISGALLKQKTWTLEAYYRGYNTQREVLSASNIAEHTINFALKEETQFAYPNVMVAGMIAVQRIEEKTFWQETKGFIQDLKQKIEDKIEPFSPEEAAPELVEKSTLPIVVPTTSNIQQLHIFPNPFVEQLNLTYQSDQDETVELRLVDESGKVVFKQTKKIRQGENKIELNPILPMGTYWLHLDNGEDEPLVELVVHLKRA